MPDQKLPDIVVDMGMSVDRVGNRKRRRPDLDDVLDPAEKFGCFRIIHGGRGNTSRLRRRCARHYAVDRACCARDRLGIKILQDFGDRFATYCVIQFKILVVVIDLVVGFRERIFRQDRPSK